MKGRKIFVSLAAAALCALGIGSAVAFASGDQDDTLPVSKAYTATNSGNTVFKAGTTTIECKKSVIKFSTDATGNIAQVDNITSKTFEECKAGAEAATVTTSGTWQVTYVDNPADRNDSETLGNNDNIEVLIPQNGAEITLASGVTIKIAPSSTISVQDEYNDSTSVLAVKEAQIPSEVNPGAVKVNAEFTGTYSVSPGLADAS
jgi:hypothetical protein